MTDRDLIKAELQNLRNILEDKADMCIGSGKLKLLSFANACSGALNLLEEQEPRVLTWEELIDVTNPVWYEERDGISSWALCTDVTRGNAYEDMSYEFFENYDNSYIREYADKCNVYWRCWTARPTDEQRTEVKWDETATNR